MISRERLELTIERELEMKKKRVSAWTRGVYEYALMILNDMPDDLPDISPFNDQFEQTLLNGAESWKHYSWSGCALCYDGEIAEMLCTPSELKRTKHGMKRPNSREQWLDTQARALYQAYRLICSKCRNAVVVKTN